MRHLACCVLVAALAASSATAHAQSSQRYTLREEIGSADGMRDVIVRSSRLPLSKPYGSMSREQQEVVRAWYTSMGPDDEPPFPARGMAPLFRVIHAIQSRLLVTGPLFLVASVDADGVVQSVTAHGSPSPEMTKLAASALMLQTFKPARCGGAPCAQEFPVAFQFEVE